MFRINQPKLEFTPRALMTEQLGFSLIEVIVSILLFTIIGAGIATSSLLSISTANRAAHDSVAMQIALESLEQFAAVDPSTLSSANNSVATVTRDNMYFTRTVSVTINSDNSRTISVDVVNPVTHPGGSASIASRFLLWGSQ